MTIAIYAGSFDPITNGHMDVLQGSLRLADEVFVAIGIHPGKAPLFSFEERMDLIKQVALDVLGKDGARIKVVAFDGLLIDAARKHKASLMVRGLRDGTDLDYEMQMAGMNSAMAPGIETVFVAAAPGVRHIAANLVRQIALMGGDASTFVSPAVAQRLKSKAKQRK